MFGLDLIFVAAGAALVAVVAAYIIGRRGGRKAEEVRQTEARQEAVETARDIDRALDGMTAEARREALARWVR